ncbi:cysteine hydrolase family protein [Aeromicrobium wangtongii]|uniref:Cysteine hydrolase n=1 Tax=Aeromicrobium wangtongii TaxID=2969247 RepID=A0ABY5M813_9ACTN|nr:isochorismatase family cysteine hydrolase [Aeromicrobium wangtongii]MCD9198715.1 cysteine hydrolase [Aeromicrobium wangtongii]UUP13239.1 cysteine hydrolase [Aeromicrobium wangtongii]
MTLTRDASALLVIDMQNGFLDPKGSMAAIGMPTDQLQPSIEGTQRLIEAARAAGVPVIFTRYQYMAGYADGGILPNELVPAMRDADALLAGSWDADVADAVAPLDGEVIIDKARPSSFYGTQLEPVLTGLGVRNLVLCGVTTNICVETTARDAGQRDYRVHVVADACAEFEQARHDHALNTIGFTFGWVNTVDEVVQAWRP